MKRIFINSAVAISAQNTFDSDNFLENIISISGKTATAQYPNYKEIIAPSASRRMATGVKMGVVAATKALNNAHLATPDAIITGTGMGCIEDTEKFLNTIIANDEAYLTPTSFIQSTHNTLGAQIALGLSCKSYNNTFVHAAISFESAMLDAQLLLQEEESKHILVGSVDELGKEIIHSVRMMEDKSSKGIQVPFGEGASFFVLSSSDHENAIEMIDMEICSVISKENLQSKLVNFLERNAINSSEIDILINGRNGDVYDTYYDDVAENFPDVSELHYKHLSGEFYTASSFGLWLAYQILMQQTIPKSLIYNDSLSLKNSTILLYNQFKGRDHSFILVKR